jgi:hypothetical protein
VPLARCMNALKKGPGIETTWMVDTLRGESVVVRTVLALFYAGKLTDEEIGVRLQMQTGQVTAVRRSFRDRARGQSASASAA